MALAALTIAVHGWTLHLDGSSSSVAVLGSLGMAVAWLAAVVLNRSEHIYEIRSSTAIFTFYLVAMASTLVILRTYVDQSHPGSTPTIVTLIVFASLLLFGFIAEALPRGSTQVQRLSGATDYDKANIFSRLTFYFFQPIVTIGLQRTLTVQDISHLLPVSLRTEQGYSKLSKLWNGRLAAHRRRYAKNIRNGSASVINNAPSLFWTVMRSHSVALVPIVACRITIVLLSFLQPVLLSRLLSYLQHYEDKPVSQGIVIAFSMFFVSLSVALLYTYNRYQMFLLSVATKTALISMVYRKALRLSPSSRLRSSTGEIVNHVSIDAEIWGDAFIYLSSWISIPVEIGIALVLLYMYLGWSMIAGFVAMVLLLPIQTWQAKVFESMQTEKLAATDQRVRLTTEVLAGMRVVRLYGWSAAFLKRLLGIRKQELMALRKIGIVQAFMSIIFISSSLIISLITFGVYALWGGPNFTPGKLTPQTVFVSMTLFSMLRNPIASLSEATTTTISVVVGTRRIQEFLLREEVNEEDVVKSKDVPRNISEPLVLIKDASFSWIDPEESSDIHSTEQDRLLGNDQQNDLSHLILRSINLSTYRQELTAIVGRVGQGKSSLLNAIIGEMYKLQGGLVQTSGRIAYVPQQAWIFNATLRDNILFGKPFDNDRYQNIVFACGLEPDLTMLPAGDMTEIGERGINLSGGQKQRVSLARAAYCDADIYLLDDPLSAVDAHVDRHLWNHLIGPKGLLRDKTRILVTHGIHHLKEVNKIVVLKDGTIVEQGHYDNLMKAQQTFYQLIKEFSIDHALDKAVRRRRKSSVGSAIKARGSVEVATASSEIAPHVTEIQDVGDLSFEEITTEEDDTDESNDNDTVSVLIQNASPEGSGDAKKDTKAELIATEKMQGGSVSRETYLIYFRALSYRYIVTIAVLFIVAQACLVGSSLWLKHWIKRTEMADEDPENTETPSVQLFLGVYALLTLFYVIVYVAVSWLMFAVARIRASEILHRNLLSSILRLPMSFFDTTPLGRILNRFSSDFSSVDDRIPNKLYDYLYFIVTVSSTMILILFTTPQFLWAIPFLLTGYWVIQHCFLKISVPTQRIYSVSKSPVYQHFSESLNGVSTIRAMGVQDQYINANSGWTDKLANNFLGNMTSKRWVEVQLRLLSTFVALFAALFAVLGRASLDPSLVGLTLSFALALTEEVTSLVRIYCDLQNHLVAVERVVEYTDMATEAPEHTDVYLPPHWPSQGHVRFNNYSTRYRQGLDLVLRSISIDISPGQSIGIVGRTGAGKSSLTLALFRIIEAADSYWAKASDNTGRAQLDSAAVAEAASSESRGDSGDSTMTVNSLRPYQEEYDAAIEGGGSIEIDGIDISTLGLEELRKSLAIIPQDPTLFAGTIRENLDPFQEVGDAELWEALERSHLKDTIASLPGGLSFEVSQNGENFS
ncbi:Multidrug resistance-associated protein 1, partial [Dissophora globulifera]